MFATIKPTLLAIVVLGVSTSAFAAGGKGMTWGKIAHDNALGIDLVSCHAGGVSCDAYRGETSCSTKLPVLCIKNDNSPRPNYAITVSGAAMEPAFYRGWAQGHIATTLPVLGSSLVNPTLTNNANTGDNLCKTAFGADWRMAEHHDGKYVSGMNLNYQYGNANWNSATPWPTTGLLTGGWAFYAYGNVRSDTRYWVRINDQPGNCWNP